MTTNNRLERLEVLLDRVRNDTSEVGSREDLSGSASVSGRDTRTLDVDLRIVSHFSPSTAKIPYKVSEKGW